MIRSTCSGSSTRKTPNGKACAPSCGKAANGGTGCGSSFPSSEVWGTARPRITLVIIYLTSLIITSMLVVGVTGRLVHIIVNGAGGEKPVHWVGPVHTEISYFRHRLFWFKNIPVLNSAVDHDSECIRDVPVIGKLE